MKKFIITALALLATACAGSKAREHVLLPAMQAAFPAIREDAEKGLTLCDPQYVEPGRAEIAEMQAALDANSTVLVALAEFQLTPGLAVLALNAQISRNELSPEAAESIFERLVQFDKAHKAMRGDAKEFVR